MVAVVFLSTPSVRRATTSASGGPPSCGISIHALREEGDRHRWPHRDVRRGISIHALREEGDPEPLLDYPVKMISIHALREEGDLKHKAEAEEILNFYPRPP